MNITGRLCRMPTYEYACSKCGHNFESFQSMSAAPLRKCPKCGKQSLKRLLGGGAGLIFKGSGFYITDYKKSGSGGSKEGGGSEKPKSESTASKPETPSKPTSAKK